MLENQEAIDYLNNLEAGMFCTINIPLNNNEKIPITAMYMGKDSEDRYNFIDTDRFIMTENFIKNKSISIDKHFDENKAIEIHSRVHMRLNKKKNKHKER